jgi:hypothetical protein
MNLRKIKKKKKKRRRRRNSQLIKSPCFLGALRRRGEGNAMSITSL